MVQTIEAEQGIGWGNRTLKEMLDEIEKLYQESGYYFGLKTLPHADQDPMKLELFHSRLLSAAIAGRETTRMISAAPQVREVAELAVALYTPEGDCILQSNGIIIHIPLMGQVIQWMIRQGYEDEGISDGDCYTSNDCAIAGLHTADIYDIQPIFHQDKLVGWVGCVIMEAEIGGLLPGCMPCGATDRYVDGLKFTAEKSAVNNLHLKSYERRVQAGIRMADMFLLNRKGALAADIKVKSEINRIIEDFGIDYYMNAIREIIELERRTQIERVKRRTVPGKFHSPSTIEIYMTRTIAPPHHAVDRITLVPWDFHIKPNGTYYIDFDGAGSWRWHVHNSTPSSLTGAVCMVITQTISYTGKSNHGTFLTVNMNTPYDTFANPGTPNFPACNLFAWPENGGPKLMAQQSHAFFCRGFVEEVRAGSTSCAGGGGAIAGKDAIGKDYSFLSTEPAGAMGGGAFAIRDGVISEGIWQPDTDMGNVEIWELMLPMLWLGRKLLPDSCGFGKYRSGYSLISTYLIYKTPQLAIEIGPASQNDRIYPDLGMFGGYVGPSSWTKLLVDTNTRELIKEKKPLPHGADKPGYSDLETVQARKSVVETSSGTYIKDIVKDGDIWQCFYGATPAGFGDPIKRDPALAKRDLDNGLLTIESCRHIYCIEAYYDDKTEEWIIDEAKTAILRADKRKERLAKGVPAEKWWKDRRQDLIDNRMPLLVRQMYNDSLSKGQRWSQEFRDFWQLEKDFVFKES
ncbi:MAG: hydantoinase B/oxoprolinase family protein [Dehalococcoidales bacterium]|nr:hydantoinase B/oxoprolinase family protein [Dehalococcoidales bacterium]